MVKKLVEKLVQFDQVTTIICTFNIPESLNLPKNPKINIINNKVRKGFGENHNYAFKHFKEKFFCVLNPDIQFIHNPFPKLISLLEEENCGVVAPTVCSPNKNLENTWRTFPTPTIILKKAIGLPENHSKTICKDCNIHYDWVAGMFMLFRSDIFQIVHGFDENYFLYYEDVDICYRLKNKGYYILGDTETKVIHYAQRDSHKKLNFFIWHLMGMTRFFLKRFKLCFNIKSNI